MMIDDQQEMRWDYDNNAPHAMTVPTKKPK
jgi:hypothetical protein